MEFKNVQIEGKGKVLLQVVEDSDSCSRWGFYLTDGINCWDGGFGIASNKTIVATKRTSKIIETTKFGLEEGHLLPDLDKYKMCSIYR
jgi:hypothetical protein